MQITIEELKQRTDALKLHGVLAHWDTLDEQQHRWLETVVAWEEQERQKRSVERRLRNARIGAFKPLADFDWNWPEKCDKGSITDLMTLEFLKEATNVILVGSNGLGKSTIAQNIVYQAVMHGHTALFASASQILGDLASQDGDNALRRRLKYYSQPHILAIDEVGYLSYGTRHADLLFEIINRRYEKKSTLVTTNRPFSEWSEVFPNASCVVSLVDRLIHHSEIIVIEGSSFRMKEATERAQGKTGSANNSSK